MLRSGFTFFSGVICITSFLSVSLHRYPCGSRFCYICITDERERERGFWQRLFRSFQVAFSGDYWLQQKQKQGLEIGGKDMRLKGGAPGIYIFS